MRTDGCWGEWGRGRRLWRIKKKELKMISELLS